MTSVSADNLFLRVSVDNLVASLARMTLHVGWLPSVRAANETRRFSLAIGQDDHGPTLQTKHASTLELNSYFKKCKIMGVAMP